MGISNDADDLYRTVLELSLVRFCSDLSIRADSWSAILADLSHPVTVRLPSAHAESDLTPESRFQLSYLIEVASRVLTAYAEIVRDLHFNRTASPDTPRGGTWSEDEWRSSIESIYSECVTLTERLRPIYFGSSDHVQVDSINDLVDAVIAALPEQQRQSVERDHASFIGAALSSSDGGSDK